jgi:hypothetical protein
MAPTGAEQGGRAVPTRPASSERLTWAVALALGGAWSRDGTIVLFTKPRQADSSHQRKRRNSTPEEAAASPITVILNWKPRP